MELTDDQCTILILRGQVTDLERERDELQKKVDELSRFLSGGVSGGSGVVTIRCGDCGAIVVPNTSGHRCG